MRSVHSIRQATISSDQALAMAKQCGAVMYVETSAKTSDRSTASAFEVAGLSSMGQFSGRSTVISSTIKPSSQIFKRRDRSEPRLRGPTINCFTPPCLVYPSPLSSRSRTSSLSSTSLCSKSSTLSSTKSDSSVISISTIKAPLVSIRTVRKVKDMDTVNIKCQRLNSHKEVEEVEIE